MSCDIKQVPTKDGIAYFPTYEGQREELRRLMKLPDKRLARIFRRQLESSIKDLTEKIDREYRTERSSELSAGRGDT